MMDRIRAMVVAGVCWTVLAVTARAAEWAQILGPAAHTVLPAAQDKVVWREDLAGAMAEAKATNRPIFVTFRCLPCKQCSAFDKDVLEGIFVLCHWSFVLCRAADVAS